MWHMVNQHLWSNYLELIPLDIKKKELETLQLSLGTLMQSYINVLFVQHQHAIKLITPGKRMQLNANIATLKWYYKDIFHLLIAQVTMFWWLQCLQEQLSWTQHFFLLLEMKHAHNLKQVSILLQLKLWSLRISLFFRTKLILSSKTKMHVLGNNSKSRNLLKELLQMELLSYLYLHSLVITLKQWLITFAEFQFQIVEISMLIPRWLLFVHLTLTNQDRMQKIWKVVLLVVPLSKVSSK